MSFNDRFLAKLAAAGVEVPALFVKILNERPEGTYYANYDEYRAADSAPGRYDAPSRSRTCPIGSTFVTNTSGTSKNAVFRLAERFKIPCVINTLPVAQCGQLNADGFELAVIDPDQAGLMSMLWSLWFHGTSFAEKAEGIVPEELLTYSEDRKVLLDNDKSQKYGISGVCYRPDLFECERAEKYLNELREREQMPHEFDGGIFALDLTAIGYRKEHEFQTFNLDPFGDGFRHENFINEFPEPERFEKKIPEFELDGEYPVFVFKNLIKPST